MNTRRMRGLSSIIILVLIGAFCLTCKTGNISIPNQQFKEYEQIMIGRHTWHTGIILERNSIRDKSGILNQLYPRSKFIEIGWGDYDFFRSEKATFGMAVKALLWPTNSVIHVLPYYRDPGVYFEDDQIIEILTPDFQFSILLDYISESFAIDENGKVLLLEAENTVGGQFYLSVEKYHLFKTCNVWTAKGLKTAGIPINPFYAFGSENVMRQLDRIKEQDAP